MSSAPRKLRLRTPLMLAFRSAHEAGDARKQLDIRDDSGERVIAGRRSTTRGAATETTIRREVSRDLETLMNTINMESSFYLGDCEFVRQSILNYGLPDVAHRTIDEGGVDDIVQEIEDALLCYEPRLVRNSVRVERDMKADVPDLQVRFVVRADMWSDPLKVPVEFFADVQVDTGKVAISRL